MKYSDLPTTLVLRKSPRFIVTKKMSNIDLSLDSIQEEHKGSLSHSSNPDSIESGQAIAFRRLFPLEEEDSRSLAHTMAWVFFLSCISLVFWLLDMYFSQISDVLALYSVFNVLNYVLFAISCFASYFLTRVAEAKKLIMNSLVFCYSLVLFALGFWRMSLYKDGNPVLSFILGSMGILVGSCSDSVDIFYGIIINLRYLEIKAELKEIRETRRSDRLK